MRPTLHLSKQQKQTTFWPLLQQFPPIREAGPLTRRAKRQANRHSNLHRPVGQSSLPQVPRSFISHTPGSNGPRCHDARRFAPRQRWHYDLTSAPDGMEGTVGVGSEK